ncbi:hypothetical protein DY000_02040489 [Brassica cretica]|uniref:Uncharacterized protein n=1 Tax=Brassica cretica TaxID=69181 RepID=A0ABQ7BGI0_BRACR|nr:hypothetical protein DY000_02040489 [Brassica cretica]
MRLWFLSEHRREVIKSDFLGGIGSSFRVPSALSLCQIRDPISARMANTRCDKPLGKDHSIVLGYELKRFRNENWWNEESHNSCRRLLMFPNFYCCLI